MKPTRLIRLLCGIITLDHHCQNCVASSGRKKPRVWRLWPTLLPPGRPSSLPLRHTPGRACKSWDPQAPAPMSRRGWRSPRGGPGRAEGVRTVCAYFRDPYLRVRVQHRRATVPPQAVLSFQPPPQQPPLYSTPPQPSAGNRRVQGRARRWWGAPSDFKDIDRRFSIVQKPCNSSDGPTPKLPPLHCHPAQHQLKSMAPKSLSEERRIAMWQTHSCKLYDTDPCVWFLLSGE